MKNKLKKQFTKRITDNGQRKKSVHRSPFTVHRGSAILISIGVTAVMFIAALSISAVIISSFRSTADITLANQSFYASEGGVEQAILKLAGRGPGYEEGWTADSQSTNLPNGAHQRFKIDNRILEEKTGTLLAGESLSIPLYRDDGLDQTNTQVTLANLNPDWVNFDLNLSCGDQTDPGYSDCTNLSTIQSDQRITPFAVSLVNGDVKSGDDDLGEDLAAVASDDYRVWDVDTSGGWTSGDRVYRKVTDPNDPSHTWWAYVGDLSSILPADDTRLALPLGDPASFSIQQLANNPDNPLTVYHETASKVSTSSERLTPYVVKTIDPSDKVQPQDEDVSLPITDVSYELLTANDMNGDCSSPDVDTTGTDFGVWDTSDLILGNVYGDGNWYLLYKPSTSTRLDWTAPNLEVPLCHESDPSQLAVIQSLEKISNIKSTSSDLAKPFAFYLDLDANNIVSTGVVGRWVLTFKDPTGQVITMTHDIDKDESTILDASRTDYDFVVSGGVSANLTPTSASQPQYKAETLSQVLADPNTTQPILTLNAFARDLQYRLNPCNPNTSSASCPDLTAREPFLPSPTTKILSEGESGATQQILQTQIEQRGFIPIFNKTVVF